MTGFSHRTSVDRDVKLSLILTQILLPWLRWSQDDSAFPWKYRRYIVASTCAESSAFFSEHKRQPTAVESGASTSKHSVSLIFASISTAYFTTTPTSVSTCRARSPFCRFLPLPALRRPIRTRQLPTPGLYRTSTAHAQLRPAGHGASVSWARLAHLASPPSRPATAASIAGLMVSSHVRVLRSAYLAAWLFR